MRAHSASEGLGSALGFAVGIAVADHCFDTGPYRYEIHAVIAIFGMISGVYIGHFCYRLIGSRRNYEQRIATTSRLIMTAGGIFCVLLGLAWVFAYVRTARAEYLMMASVLLALGLEAFPLLDATFIPAFAGLAALAVNVYLICVYGASFIFLIGAWLSAGLASGGFVLRKFNKRPRVG